MRCVPALEAWADEVYMLDMLGCSSVFNPATSNSRSMMQSMLAHEVRINEESTLNVLGYVAAPSSDLVNGDFERMACLAVLCREFHGHLRFLLNASCVVFLR